MALRLLLAALAAALVLPAVPAATPAPAQGRFLALAEQGLAQARARWWDAGAGWYRDRLDPTFRPSAPLAYLWSAFGLFEAVDAVAIADPTPAHRRAVRAFAAGARRYWNPDVGGFAYYPGTRGHKVTYFDDNGWWAIAFLDAYRATGDRADLADAARAFWFIATRGWAAGGGTWWDTRHGHITAEPLAAAAFVGAALYGATGEERYLQTVDRMVAWADRASFDPRARLYQRSPTSPVDMDYVEGMMIGADLELCRYAHRPADCAKARALARASLAAFPPALDWSPTADAIYLRFLLDLFRADGDRRLYELAAANADRAVAHAGPGGLYTRSWGGAPIPGGLLRTEAGTLSLLAWLAATPAPG